jgi:hypothetical protein
MGNVLFSESSILSTTSQVGILRVCSANISYSISSRDYRLEVYDELISTVSLNNSGEELKFQSSLESTFVDSQGCAFSKSTRGVVARAQPHSFRDCP